MSAFHPPRRTILVAGILFVLAAMAVDLHLTRKYAGVDLRDKLVAARSLMDGRSLYYDPWQPGQDERFADPMVPAGAVMTRYTGTPFQALVLAPLGMPSFTSVRIPWLLAQYALLLITVLTVWRAFGSGQHTGDLLALAVVLVFVGSTSWRLHVERAQVYIMFAALLAGLFVALQQRRHMLAGALGAALILFKPTYAVLLLPLLLRSTPRMWVGGLSLAAVTLVIFSIIPGGLTAWKEYPAAMKTWSGYVGMGAPPSADPEAFTYPDTIEGMQEPTLHHPMEFENGSVAVLFHVFGMDLPGWLPYLALLIFLGGAFALHGQRLLRTEATDLLLLGFCAWTLFMMLLPVPRFDYQVVHWLAPLAVVLLLQRDRPMWWWLTAAMAGVMLLGGLAQLPVNVLIAEVLMLLLLLCSLHARLQQPGT